MARKNRKPLPPEFRHPWRLVETGDAVPLLLHDAFGVLELVENLPAGESAVARVRPLVPESWAGLCPGDSLALYIGPDPIGTAILLERVSQTASKKLMPSRHMPVTPLEVATVQAIVGLRLGDARRLPDLAAQYVAFGINSDALIDLAGLDVGQPTDPFDARDLYTQFLVDVSLPTNRDADTEVCLASAFLARQSLLRLEQPRQLCQRFYTLAVALDHEWPFEEIGELYGLDDEWLGGWGRTPEQLEAATDAACKSLLAKVERLSGVLDQSAVARIHGLF